MTLTQLRYFCTAARCHSITRAAKQLFVTQPTVSAAIRELEREFSMTLFSYTNNRMELTKEGESFYQKATDLLRASDEMQAQLRDAGRTRPAVRLGIPTNLSTVFFPELMDAFHEEYPDIELRLSEFGSVRTCRMVQDEQLDLGLVTMEQYAVDKFANLVLAEDRLLFCVTAQHPLADRKELSLHELDGQKIILFNHDALQSQRLKQLFHAIGIEPQIVMYCSQLITTLKFVRQGKYGCFLFSSMLPVAPELIGIPLKPEISTRLGLVWKKGQYVSASTRTFIHFCRRYFAREAAASTHTSLTSLD